MTDDEQQRVDGIADRLLGNWFRYFYGHKCGSTDAPRHQWSVIRLGASPPQACAGCGAMLNWSTRVKIQDPT